MWGRLGAQVTVVEFLDRIVPTMVPRPQELGPGQEADARRMRCGGTDVNLCRCCNHAAAPWPGPRRHRVRYGSMAALCGTARCWRIGIELCVLWCRTARSGRPSSARSRSRASSGSWA